ncbi:hypothetical protein PG997_009023 [Apiospora hydei]|uniref:Rhodopsin domain-containing protein n=1 Tax=Apiospora hydei TaxID=1337664 RepID=A0ABR1WCF9_9PEZI
MTFLVLCWIVVGLRVYCRVHVVKSFGPDDFSLVVLQCYASPQLVYTGYLVTQLLGWQHGTGRHKSALSEADNSRALMFWFICELLYIACTCLLKLAAGQFLLRLAVDARHVWALRALMLSTALFGTAYFFLVLFQCGAPAARRLLGGVPRAAPGDRCWSDLVVLALTYAASAVNCLADWCFGLMPVPRRAHAQYAEGDQGPGGLSHQLRGHGHALSRIQRHRRSLTQVSHTHIYTVQTTDVALWSTVEVGIGIAALSLAALHPLIAHWRRRLGLAHVS